jgi:hypothetical protein
METVCPTVVANDLFCKRYPQRLTVRFIHRNQLLSVAPLISSFQLPTPVQHATHWLCFAILDMGSD